MESVKGFLKSFSDLFNFNEAVLSGTHDVIVVEDDSGALRASAFHVRFGKLKLLKSKEAIVEIRVNGELVPVTMKLSGDGEAYFVDESGMMLSPRKGREVPVEESKSTEEMQFDGPQTDPQPFFTEMRRMQESRKLFVMAQQPSPTPGDRGEDIEAENIDFPTPELEDGSQIELSLCGHLRTDFERAFEENRVTYEDLRKDAWGVLSNPNLLVRMGGTLYPADAAIPLIISLLAFKKSIPVNSDESSPGVTYEDHIQSAPKSIYLDSSRLKTFGLRPGANEISFTVHSRLQGAQILEGRVYLWRYDSRIVISDVDGTITRSDVLGNILPIVGKDWSHNGVCPLYNKIVENGYKLMYLTSRPIGDVERTKNYLKTLRQGDLGLPDGPLFTSPDRLMPSFVREVILKESQKFKAGVLRELQLLFPRRQQPFHAGFGNRENDAVAYGAVGIPLDRIFIINPAGEIALLGNLEVLTYSTLAPLVEDVFPSLS